MESYLDEVVEIHYEIHVEHGYYDQHDAHVLHVIHDEFHDDPDGDLRDGHHLEDELLGWMEIGWSKCVLLLIFDR